MPTKTTIRQKIKIPTGWASSIVVVVIDCYFLMYRNFYALPIHNKNQGIPINALFGFYRNLAEMLIAVKSCANKIFIFAVDDARQSFRKKITPTYKASRSKTPDTLLPQLRMLTHDIVQELNMPLLSDLQAEADDLIASFVINASKTVNTKICIVSPDKDLASVVTENITMLSPINNRCYGPQEIADKFGVTPQQMTDFLILVGDASDNIKGVPNIGTKTAALLLQKYGSINNIIDNIDQLSPNMQNNFNESQEIIELNRKLIHLKTDLNLPFTLQDIPCNNLTFNKLRHICAKYNFSSIIKKLNTASDLFTN